MINQTPTILHAIDTTGPGGAETVFLDLAQHLTVEGFNNFAIIKGPGWVEDQLIARDIPYTIVKPHGLLSLPYYWTLFQLLRKHNVKLIQAHLLGSTLTYSLLSMLLRIPLVATIHGQVDINPNERHVYLKNRIMRWGVDRLVAVSQQLANYISERKLFDQTQIEVIYNGVDIQRYGRCQSREVRQKLSLEDDAFLIGCVGNVRPAKAYDVLIDAAKILKTEFPKVHFVIAGHQKPKLMGELEEQLKRQQMESRVHFIGFHPNTAEFLGQMDMFALSSTSEGFSIATIEAMATGLAVVATRCGGPEEILSNNETGLLVEAGSSEALASAIRSLIKSKALRQDLKERAKGHTIANFSMQTTLSNYHNIFNKLLAPNAPVNIRKRNLRPSESPKGKRTSE
ncbi:glycosyltransferase family 4 protein [Marinimicrobium locisalis]|uniref:glycosyltransferase family 4 protein n=1 Tax=Marinimicrobium locisalis TaxID=546022 RepID=UPI0032217249